MVERLTREQIARHAEIHEGVPGVGHNRPVDRTFELPTVLFAATAGLLFAFLGVMALGFGNPALAIPFAIFGIFIVGFFGVPAIWTRMAPENPARAMSWAQFQRDGVMTPFGRVTAREATVQVLILPVLVFLWGVCVAIVAALV